MSDWKVNPLMDGDAAAFIGRMEQMDCQNVRAVHARRGDVHARVLISRDPWHLAEWAEGGPMPAEDWRWHISVAIVAPEARTPLWEELASLAHQLRPSVGFVAGVPPRSLWMNIHPHTLHLWETKEEALWDEWRRNSRGDQPT